jgi:transposase
MTRALSLDLRERVVAAMVGGASCREAAKTFSVSVASAARWSKRARDTGSTAPRPFGKRLGLVLLPEREWLLARVAAAPDLTVRALRAELEAVRGICVGYGAVWRFLAREGLTFKKKPARRRAAQAGRRTQA